MIIIVKYFFFKKKKLRLLIELYYGAIIYKLNILKFRNRNSASLKHTLNQLLLLEIGDLSNIKLSVK